jgi:hypothetical protein
MYKSNTINGAMVSLPQCGRVLWLSRTGVTVALQYLWLSTAPTIATGSQHQAATHNEWQNSLRNRNCRTSVRYMIFIYLSATVVVQWAD